MKEFSICLLILLVSLFLIVSCGEEKDNEKSQEELDLELLATVQLEKIEDIDSYTIVVADTASDELKDRAGGFVTSLNNALGTNLKLKTDYAARKGTNKIIIGNSKHHDIDSETMRFTDYVIKKNGESIVIIGGSEKATFLGVDFFVRNLLKKDAKEIYYPIGDGLEYVIEFKLDSLKIDGVDISEFKIFAVDNIEEGAALANDIGWEYLGIEIPVEGDVTLPDGDKYIILDRQSYDYYNYSMTIENGNLYVKGSFRSFPKALDALVSYLDGSHGTNVNITADDNLSGALDKVTLPYNSKEELLEIYKYATKTNQTLYGEHLGGGYYSIEELESTIRADVGDGPAIISYDMLSVYIGTSTRSDTSRIICEALEFASRGGIITTGCHWQNPNEQGRFLEVKQWDGTYKLQDSIHQGSVGSKELWDSLFIDGTEYNKSWKAQLDCNAEIYQAFKDLGLPVTFRPMHEANGEWFWWGMKSYLTSEDLREMWLYVRSYYDELELDNILWIYAPNYGSVESVISYYPGDDKCDLIGMDWYGIDPLEERSDFRALLSYGKPTGFSEWGLPGNLQLKTKEETAKFFNNYNLVNLIKAAKAGGVTITFIEAFSGYFGATTWLEYSEVLNETEGIVLLDDMPDIIKNALGK